MFLPQLCRWLHQMLFPFGYEYPKKELGNSAELALKWFENNYMRADPSKFQAILFNCSSYVIHCCRNQEVFALNIGLSFNEHVSNLCLKATRQTNMLHRIVKYIPNECRLNIYQASMSSNFKYCDIVWHRNTYEIEKVHKNALWVTLIYYTSSLSDMLLIVKRSTLYM